MAIRIDGNYSLSVITGEYLRFIGIIRRNYTRSYNIQSFSYPAVGVVLKIDFI